ncbi:MAG: hypothetical protein RLY30_866 [Pseudomonadota bacterium]|jgi:hypothetical protein
MKVLISVIDSDTGRAASGEITEINAFNDRLRLNGQFIFADGLASPQDAWLIDHRREAGTSMAPGPLYLTEEYLSGFWILEVRDLSEAQALAMEASRCCNRRVELRPFIQRPPDQD